MAYQIAATAVTLKVIHWLQAFSNAIHRTFMQHFTRFQLTMCSHGSSALAELLVDVCNVLGYISRGGFLLPFPRFLTF